MITIYFNDVDVLAYFDGVEVFSVRDSIGGHYVGMIVERIGDVDRYLVTGVTPERLRQLRSGVTDLRTVFLESPGGEWYLASTHVDPDLPIILERQEGSLVDSILLPGEGFLLGDVPADDLALVEARERNNVVFEFSADPPESAMGHRIRAETLARLLLHVQTIVSHAYRRAVSDLPDQSRNAINTRGGHLMDVVVPATAGSFRMILEASNPSDMFGYGELVKGLERLDSVFATADHPESAGDALRQHQGHLAGSYIRLMRFLAEHRTGLRYGWAYPGLNLVRSGGVSNAVAVQLVESLSEATTLGTEEVTFLGTFDRFNLGPGDWGLSLLEDGSRVIGRIAQGGPSLGGLVAGGVYRFDCIEEIETDALGNERRTYYLKSLQDQGV